MERKTISKRVLRIVKNVRAHRLQGKAIVIVEPDCMGKEERIPGESRRTDGARLGAFARGIMYVVRSCFRCAENELGGMCDG